jgi:hypothetical protein
MHWALALHFGEGIAQDFGTGLWDLLRATLLTLARVARGGS